MLRRSGFGMIWRDPVSHGGHGGVRSVKFRRSVFRSGGCGALCLGRMCYGWASHGKSWRLRHGLVRSAKFWRGGERRVEVSQGKAVMVCKGYFRHGLSWYGGYGTARLGAVG